MEIKRQKPKNKSLTSRKSKTHNNTSKTNQDKTVLQVYLLLFNFILTSFYRQLFKNKRTKLLRRKKTTKPTDSQ